MLSDLAAAPAFLALGLHQFSGPWVVAGGVAIVGFMSCGLLDTLSSVDPARPTLSGEARARATPRRAQSAHQHATLRHPDRRAGHLGVARSCASGRAPALLVFGLYAGYDYFALVHHWQHHRGHGLARVGYLRRLERLHHVHHHRQVVNFGISTTIWDRLFGTFQPTPEPATDYIFWSTIDRTG